MEGEDCLDTEALSEEGDITLLLFWRAPTQSPEITPEAVRGGECNAESAVDTSSSLTSLPGGEVSEPG